MSAPELDYRRLFEALPEKYLILLPDEAYTIVGMSESYRQLTHMRREDIIGRGIFEVFPDNPEDVGATGERNLATSLERACRTRAPDAMAVQKYSVRKPPEEGGGYEERWWSPVNAPVLDDRGEVVYLIHRVEEVTEFVRLREAREKDHQRSERMEREIFARGQEIQAANERLREANSEITKLYERTKELDALKTQFFAAVSHELRTPLALILGPAEKLSGSASDEGVKRELDVIVRNARTLLRHVSDLLDVAKLEAGRMRLEYGEENVAELLRFVAGHFDALAKERRIAFEVEAQPTCSAQVDVEKLRGVLFNLLSNAFKFTPDGGRVRASLRESGESGAQIAIEVADSGPGIPEEQREAVFERFHQLEGGTTRRFGGTGLGLAIARELVVLHGGSIAAERANEGGALLRVELPRRAPAGVEVHGPKRVEDEGMRHAVASLRADRARGTAFVEPDDGRDLVLVVEDNPEMSRFVAEALASRYRVATAFDGRLALELALSLHPCLIVSDVMMPGMSGDQLLRAVRSRAEIAEIPMVILTAKADDALRVQLLREGAQDFVTKPFLVEELCTRVDNLVALRRAETTSRQLSERLEAVARAHNAVTAALARIPEESLTEVLRTIALRARELTDAEFVAVGIESDPKSPFDPWVAIDSKGESAGVLLARRIGVPAPNLTSFLEMPIRHRGKTIGNLYLGNKRAEADFNEADRQMIAMFAERAGAAIDAARFYTTVGMERAWLQNVIEQMPEALLLVDAKGHPTHENRVLAALVSHTGEHDPWGNELPLDLRTPSGERLAGEQRPYVRALHGVPVDREEFVVHREGGETMPVAVSACPVRDRDGVIVGATMIVQDLTTQKELGRLREEWSTIIAHDLRQPVSVINAAAQLLPRMHQGAVSPAELEMVRRISAATTTLRRMVDELLDSSRLEAHRMKIELRPISLPPLIRDVVERTPEIADRCDLHVDPEALGSVAADPQRIEQVFANLVSNAAKYASPESEIRVDVAPLGDEIEVTVSNRGRGIDPDELPHLFHRFRRSRAGVESSQGLGLGLYICKGLIEAHHGRIWAESTPNEVTSFHFTLPRAA